MTPSDAALIARVVGRDDRDAFGELVHRHQSGVRRFLRHLAAGDAALADDLAQEAFVEAWRNLARFRGEASFTTWVLGIAHNRWRNAWRRRRTEQAAAAAAEPPAPTPSPAPASDLRQDLAAALRLLSAEEQTAMHLFYRQGLTHSEIAAVLEWPLGTVKTHLARGKDKLRQHLSAWNPQT
ncbi:MAG TPA: sigma-70 family RNA polymerase sigma factor [Opitutaceae bacterium]|nr:sigma-70 family RNA polymerase sigma factor [Opitutaceae bacterium]